jgi:regulator of sigma E protease
MQILNTIPEILVTVLRFIVTIGVLVLIHELGHFLAAKFFKMRVDVFSLGFPPRAFGKQIGETDYCLSWIPIGGYVKIAGMVDESFDTEFANSPPQPWEFRSKPAWQRIVVLSAGVVMNILFAVVIFWGIIYHQGRVIHPVTEIGYVTPNSAAATAGFLAGDRILTVDGTPATSWDDVESRLYTESLSKDVRFTIDRRGTVVSVTVAQSIIPNLSDERFGFLPKGFVPVVTLIEAGKPAEQIGLMPGDTIVAVNGTAVSYGSLPEVIRANAGKEIVLRWKRGAEERDAHVTPTAEGRIGISLTAAYHGPVIRQEYGLVEALPISAREVTVASAMFLENLYQIITGKVSLAKSVGGPIRIAQMANRYAESGAISFLGFMAMLSVSLALLNILPFPALDGGHIVFVVFEAIFRREVPVRVKIAIQKAGFFLILAFMAFVVYNDIVHF